MKQITKKTVLKITITYCKQTKWWLGENNAFSDRCRLECFSCSDILNLIQEYFSRYVKPLYKNVHEHETTT